MPLVYVDELAAGMVLADDLLTPSGRFVLAAGAELQAQHLQLLKSWGVIEADIEAASLGESCADQQAVTAAHEDQARLWLQPRFALNNPEQEPVATLYRHLVHFFALRFAQGWEPNALAGVPRGGGTIPPPLSMPQLLKGGEDIFSLPTLYAHLVELLRKPTTSTAQIAAVVGKDANLTVRLLRLVNSPFYSFSGRVDSVSRAVSLIGMDELTSLTLGVTVVQQFRNLPIALLDMDRFWRHSIRCGLFAKALAEQLGERETEKYFTGGLLHDVGRLVLLERMPAQYAQAIARARAESLPLYRAEQDCLKTDHSIIGKLLAEKWRLSATLIRMIGSHHSPRLANYQPEACLLHSADILAHACSDDLLLVKEVPQLQQTAWDKIGLGREVIAPVMQQVDAEFREIVKVFFGD